MTDPVFYYRAEVKGIQHWILASDRLRELKGGSAIVDGLADDARKLADTVGVAAEHVIQAAAGAVSIHFVELDALRRFAAIWPVVVANRAPGLAVVQAWDTQQGKVHQKLRGERNRLSVEVVEAGPLLARSGRTGEPAVGGGSRTGLTDAGVARKLLAAEQSARLDTLASDVRFTEQADDLSQGGYVALVHADGNGVGGAVMKLKQVDLRAFSQELGEATWEAVTSVVRLVDRWSLGDDNDVPAPRGQPRTLRMRPIVVGGDDVTLLVDARYGFAVAAALLRAFERETEKRKVIAGGEPLTMCAGIAIVKTGFPFHAAHELAESLCKAAKAGLRGENGTRSGVLFHRVTTATTDLSWQELRRDELNADGGGLLSGGPYGLSRLEALEEVVRAMRGLPRGSAREWLRLAREDHARANAHWQRMQEVADPAAWVAFAKELASLGHDVATGWAGTASERFTAVGDALLMRGLVGRSEASVREVP